MCSFFECIFQNSWDEYSSILPLISVLMDKELQDELMIPHDSMLHTMLDSWKKIFKMCQLGNRIKILRWCAFDSLLSQTRMIGDSKDGSQKD